MADFRLPVFSQDTIPTTLTPTTPVPGNSSVAGNVSVNSDATINAPSGYGIWAFNFGTGDTVVTTGATL